MQHRKIRSNCNTFEQKTSKEKVTLTIDGTIITENESLKIVGLPVSNKLDFDPQIEYLTKEVNKLNGALKRLSYFVDEKTLQSTANATILGKLSYAIMFIANPIINDIERANNHHKTLQKLINQTARNVLKKTRLDKIPIEELLKRANFKSINQIVIKQMLKETWRMANQDDHPLMKL